MEKASRNQHTYERDHRIPQRLSRGGPHSCMRPSEQRAQDRKTILNRYNIERLKMQQKLKTILEESKKQLESASTPLKRPKKRD